MDRYWSNIAKNIESYVPGEQPRNREYIKLNTNENPYPPSPKVAQCIHSIDLDNIRLYPDPSCKELCTVIADYYNIRKEQIFIGNGSDEVLAFSFLAFFNPEEIILFPDITYSFYRVYADLFKINYELIPLAADFSIPTQKLLTNKSIVLPNPNAPTGKYLLISEIEKILNYNKEKVIIIDEAYIDFGGESAVKLIKKHLNLLIVQTMSKSRSLAGMRVGFAMGDENLILALNQIKNSFNSYTIDCIALKVAAEAFKDMNYFEETRTRIMKTRAWVAKELNNLGFQVINSMANFIFVSHPIYPAFKLYERLKEEGFLVRYFKQPRIDNYLRISIGTDAEMHAFINIIKCLLEQGHIN